MTPNSLLDASPSRLVVKTIVIKSVIYDSLRFDVNFILNNDKIRV